MIKYGTRNVADGTTMFVEFPNLTMVNSFMGFKQGDIVGVIESENIIDEIIKVELGCTNEFIKYIEVMYSECSFYERKDVTDDECDAHVCDDNCKRIIPPSVKTRVFVYPSE